MARRKNHKGRKTRRDGDVKLKDTAEMRGVMNVPSSVPPTHCEHCKPIPFHESTEEAFDANGYPIKNKPAIIVIEALLESPERTLNRTKAKSILPRRDFRFLDLPAELRNHICELAFTRPEQPVCLPDALLRPSEDLPADEDVLRTCYDDVICLPCQLHHALGTMSCG